MFQLDPSINRMSHTSVGKTNSSKCKNYMGKVVICEQNYNWHVQKWNIMKVMWESLFKKGQKSVRLL